jgi:lipopolysaccharide export system permease protein
MPFSLALGVVMGLGRLYRDSEMTVLRACGVGPWRLYQPLLGMGIGIALLSGWMALYLGPGVSAYGDRITRQAEQQADVSIFGAGRFNSLRDGQITLYAQRLSENRKKMKNLFVHVKGEKKTGKPPQIVTAASANRMIDPDTGDEYLVFVNGYRYEGNPGDADYRIMHFARQGVRIEVPGRTRPTNKSEIVSTALLLQSTNREDIAELQWRLSVPLSVLVLVLLAVPMSQVSPRKGRYGGLAMAVLVFVIYFNLLATAKVWVEQGVIPVPIGVWWVHLLPAVLAMLLLNVNRLECRLRRAA